MDKHGVELNPHIPHNTELESILKKTVEQRWSELLLTATTMIGKKRNVEVPIGTGKTFVFAGCRVNYSAKDGRFDYIQYSVQGKRGAWYAKRIAI